MFKLRKGWTKDKMLKIIMENYAGYSASGGVCEYATDDGRKCAVGCFLPGKTGQHLSDVVVVMLDENPELDPFMPLDVKGMQALQVIHDQSDRESLGGPDDVDVVCISRIMDFIAYQVSEA